MAVTITATAVTATASTATSAATTATYYYIIFNAATKKVCKHVNYGFLFDVGTTAATIITATLAKIYFNRSGFVLMMEEQQQHQEKQQQKNYNNANFTIPALHL
jgi:hypothetical protein